MSNNPNSDLYNATYLFENKKFHSSESFWSSIFALYLIYESWQQTPKSIPVYNYYKELKWEFRNAGTLKIPKKLIIADNIIVEGTLTTFKIPR
jgi:hypothetical protein